MKQECLDCGYCVNNSCIHPNFEDCQHCELWTPKWYTDEYVASAQLFKKNFRDKVCIKCSGSCNSLFKCPKFEAVVFNLPKRT